MVVASPGLVQDQPEPVDARDFCRFDQQQSEYFDCHIHGYVFGHNTVYRVDHFGVPLHVASRRHRNPLDVNLYGHEHFWWHGPVLESAEHRALQVTLGPRRELTCLLAS